MRASARAASVPGRTGSQASEPDEVAVKRGIDADEGGALGLGVLHDAPVGDRGLGDVVAPEHDHLGVEKVGRFVTVEEAAAVARVGRVDQHVVPAGRRGAVAFVVALEVSGHGADRAGKAKAHADDPFEDGERAGVRRDPHRVLAGLRLHLLEVVGDHGGRLVPADALPLARAARADPLVGVLDAVAAVEVLELGHAAQADARRVRLGDRRAVDGRLVVGRAFDQLHLAVGDVDEMAAGAVAVVGVAGAHELLGHGRRRRGGRLQAAEERVVDDLAGDRGRAGDRGAPREEGPAGQAPARWPVLFLSPRIGCLSVVWHVPPPRASRAPSRRPPANTDKRRVMRALRSFPSTRRSTRFRDGPRHRENMAASHGLSMVRPVAPNARGAVGREAWSRTPTDGSQSSTARTP